MLTLEYSYKYAPSWISEHTTAAINCLYAAFEHNMSFLNSYTLGDSTRCHLKQAPTLWLQSALLAESEDDSKVVSFFHDFVSSFFSFVHLWNILCKMSFCCPEMNCLRYFCIDGSVHDNVYKDNDTYDIFFLNLWTRILIYKWELLFFYAYSSCKLFFWLGWGESHL